ncbi:vWA domain-containing protein [Persicirhabdus sediminis]|uniref:VWA domain-containing protein n=1 Tax=Persicirhabdus sediminis TaxID=454144 RepID=A0A8J7MDL9_9BACT|nr:VWA domain-containing protein [Persicirhabdus sediminis]MBK1789949.1 VWA domain-containing protein [Persicirhabdus sediminis]
MHLFFINSALFGILLLGVLPLLVHMFARNRPPQYAFSNVDFLQKILKKTARFKKPQDWILWFLRTLALLALLSAFLLPMISMKDEGVVADRVSRVYLIDRSASMAAEQGSSTRFQQACQRVAELLQADAPDLANVVWIQAQAQSVFPQLGKNLTYLEESVLRADVAYENGAIGSAVELAIRQLEGSTHRKEIVLLSDFQESAYSNLDINLPAGIELKKVQIGSGEVANLAISNVYTSVANPMVGQELAVVAKVHNYSSSPRRTSVFADMGGNRRSQMVELPAWGEAEIRFRSSFQSAEKVLITLSLAEDAYPADNQCSIVVPVRQSMRVAFIHAAEQRVNGETVVPNELDVWQRLFNCFDWVECDFVELDSLTNFSAATTYDYIFVNQWNGSDSELIKQWAQEGTSLVVMPAGGVPAAHLQAIMSADKPADLAGRTLLQGKPRSMLGSESSRTADASQFWTVTASARLASQDAGLFALYESGDFGSAVSGNVYQRISLPADLGEDVNHLLEYSDGKAAMLSSSAHGAPVVLWGVMVGLESSSWAESSSIVTFVGEFLKHHQSASKLELSQYPAGSYLSYKLDERVEASSVTLKKDGSESVPIAQKMSEQGVLMQSKDTQAVGVYFWVSGSETVDTQVINFPYSESNLKLMDAELLTVGERLHVDELMRMASLGDGVELWPYLILICLLLLMIENLLAMYRPRGMKKEVMR